MANPVFRVVFGLIIIGLILFFVAPYIPGQIMTFIFVAIAVGLLIWVAQLAGLIGGPPAV